MKIYAVYMGSAYDGSFIHDPLFRVETDAIMEANAIANKENEEWGCEYEFTGPKEWKDGNDFIRVVEYNLI